MKILETFFLALVFSISNAAAQEASELDQVIKALDSKQISQSRAWLKLLHIEKNWLGLKDTQITDGSFFLSGDSSDPHSEMVKTLESFLLPAKDFEKVITTSKKEKISDYSEHPICRYPARLHFLKSQLGEFSNFWNKLPVVNCYYQNIFLNAVDAKSVSYVFSSYYSDSPGSAFGHTFFRINRKSNIERQELLDYGVGYAAQVSVTNPFAYAMLGLVGGFRGAWTNLPYYYKVREYNDFESRDLWSYNLNLSEEEVLMMTLHLWEVGSHTYTYYFFTQNCAFHMLTLLEAAAPRLHLTDHIPFYYVIPADSMKALFYEKDLVNSVSYRPSLRRVFQERFKGLSEDSKKDFKNFAKDFQFPPGLETKSVAEQAKFLDASLDLIGLKFPNLTGKINEKYFLLKEDIFKKRASIDHISEPIVIKEKPEERPDYSHGSSRVSLNYLKNSDAFGFTYRFSLHDLLDNSTGLPENSQLEFGNFSFKRYDKKIELDDFSFFRVLNINPLNFYERKLSWGLKIGTQALDLKDSKVGKFYSTGFESLVGYSFELIPFEKPLIAWTMIKADLGFATENKNDSFGYQAIGFQLGLLKRFNTKNAFLLTYERMFPYKLKSFDNLNFEYRTYITKDLSLGLGLRNEYFKSEIYYSF